MRAGGVGGVGAVLIKKEGGGEVLSLPTPTLTLRRIEPSCERFGIQKEERGERREERGEGERRGGSHVVCVVEVSGEEDDVRRACLQVVQRGRGVVRLAQVSCHQASIQRFTRLRRHPLAENTLTLT